MTFKTLCSNGLQELEGCAGNVFDTIFDNVIIKRALDLSRRQLLETSCVATPATAVQIFTRNA